MDWLAFEKQWSSRHEIFQAVGHRQELDKQSSVSAFFVLMILAVGSQLCKDKSLHGIQPAEEYYALALPFLSVIVQLHNLANVQGG